MTDYTQAVSDIFALFNEAWKAKTVAIAGYIPAIRWQGVEIGANPDKSKFWARASQKTGGETQSSLRNGDNGQRYENRGTAYVQIFCPLSVAGSASTGRKLAEVARDSFRGKQSVNGVWFRNAAIKEMPVEDDWYIFLVQADYIYNEIA